MTWCAMSVECPDWYMNPVFRSHLAPDGDTFDAICAKHPMRFADGLHEVLIDKKPPTIDFFRTLPQPGKRSSLWGVYTVLMEKPSCPPKLYAGSGTAADQGIVARLQNYKTATVLPQLVEKSLQDGYSISHMGMLCWCPIPRPSQVPLARLRVIAIKATMTFVFFAGRRCEMDVLWETMLPWTRDEVAWEPLCTHTAFLEKPPGDLEMSEAELESYNAKRRERALAKMKVNSKKFEDREKAISVEAYRARKRQEKLSWTNRNRDRVHQHAKTTRTNAKNSKRWSCDACNLDLDSVTALTKHMLSKAHVERVRLNAGGTPKKVSAENMRIRKWCTQKKASGAYRCEPCKYNAGSKGHLDKHLTTKKHAKVVAARK
ncbi:hypothetical protein CGCSCA5_v000313 [Colletotrichum siamense]|nr:hypothetical protein CGCSCA5_v000313 [Colletotrichum siamense]